MKAPLNNQQRIYVMIKTLGYAAKHSFSDLKPFEIERCEPVANEVQIDILFCGVCHSDIHQVKNVWKNTVYPCMPGHEIVGRVVKAGASVTQHKVGDIVGVGCMVDSCNSCASCNEGLENYCDNGFIATYNGNMRTPRKENLTYGGYSETIVVREDFVLRIPVGMDAAASSPLMCAGVTTYSPLKHWKVGPGTKVGVAGLGGLGHMAVKLAVAMGAEVSVITTSPDKSADAKKLGAKQVILSEDKESMKQHERSLDFILSTIPVPHDVNPYMTLLKRDGTLTVVGCIAPLTKAIDLSKMIPDRKSLGTSLIGSIAETQEVLDFCAKHNIVSDIKIIDIDNLGDAFAEIENGEIDFRYVINMASLKGKKAQDATFVDKALELIS
jgi:alcohol dehydrogenase (NADP+)